jgi:hypothetical protein
MSGFTRYALGLAGLLTVIAAAHQSRAAFDASSISEDGQTQRAIVRFAEVKKAPPPRAAPRVVAPPRVAPRPIAPKVAPRVVAPKAPPRVVAPKVSLPPKPAPRSVVIPKGVSTPQPGPTPRAVGIPKTAPTALPTTKFGPGGRAAPLVGPGPKFGPKGPAQTGPLTGPGFKAGPLTGPGVKAGPLTGPGTKFGPSKVGPLVGPGKKGGSIAGPALKGPIAGPGAKFGAGKKSGPGTNITLINRRRISIFRGGRTIFVGRHSRRIVAVSALAAIAVGAAYYYPYGYVAIARPACYGVTAEGCTLHWQDVPTEEGDVVTQCVQYCPQGYVAPPVPLVEPDPVPLASPAEAPVPLAEPAPEQAAAAGCNIAIYSEPSFGGVSSETAEDQPQLGQVGWGGEIASIVIRTGTWDFFSEEEFTGDTVRLAAGAYSVLPGDWAKRIYSFMCADPAATQ